jgi:uncharacterized protein (TIGR02145 family)
MNKLCIIAVLLMGFTAMQAQMNMKIRLTNGDLITYPTSSIDSIYFEPQCIISNLTAGTQTPCDSLTNEYTQDIIITYTNATSSGSLSVNGQLFSITTSPQTITLSNLISDANPVDVDAFFTADTTCVLNLLSMFTAPNSCGCPSTFTDPRDGEVYAVVQIGNQCWMAENLRYDVPGVYGASDTINSASPSTTYGRLYDWATVMNGATTSSSNPSGVQGICPSGWHLPSDAEWNELEMALGMPAADTANTGYRGSHGTGIKSTSGWSSGAATNTSGFNAFPTGYCNSSSFSNLGDNAYFWSSTEYSSGAAWDRYLRNGNTGVKRTGNSMAYGFSCRCTKD